MSFVFAFFLFVFAFMCWVLSYSMLQSSGRIAMFSLGTESSHNGLELV